MLKFYFKPMYNFLNNQFIFRTFKSFYERIHESFIIISNFMYFFVKIIVEIYSFN
jgi:hypothetical protein